MSGHSIERCFKIHGYPTNFKSGVKDKKMVVISLNNSVEKSDSATISIA